VDKFRIRYWTKLVIILDNLCAKRIKNTRSLTIFIVFCTIHWTFSYSCLFRQMLQRIALGAHRIKHHHILCLDQRWSLILNWALWLLVSVILISLRSRMGLGILYCGFWHKTRPCNFPAHFLNMRSPSWDDVDHGSLK